VFFLGLTTHIAEQPLYQARLSVLLPNPPTLQKRIQASPRERWGTSMPESHAPLLPLTLNTENMKS
jgi:hypothetical protein